MRKYQKMENRFGQTIDQQAKKVIFETNRVLKNTYLLLSLTLLFSSITAALSISMGSQSVNPVLTFVVYMALFIGIHSTRNSSIALVLTFILTGFMGFTMGGLLNYYVSSFSNGSEMVMISIGMTGATFMGLSILAINHERNFSKLNNFLGVGSIICLIAVVLNLYLQIPALHLALSVMISFISGGIILWQTSQIVHGGEKNYIVATVALYVSIVNILMTLLQFLSIFIGRRD
jgi:modulator of FtsH protease